MAGNLEFIEHTTKPWILSVPSPDREKATLMRDELAGVFEQIYGGGKVFEFTISFSDQLLISAFNETYCAFMALHG